MNEWKECKFEEITELMKDTYSPNGKDDYKYIGLEHIEQETLRLNAVGHSTDVTSNKFKFCVNDILFGKLRPYFRKVVKPQFDGICSTDIWVFRAKNGYDQDFLFYFIANWDFVNTANGGEGGTRMPRADWNFLKSTDWILPPLPEQRAIASVLSSLDDKIDLLHRQNKTLEAMAETLFRQWFVEEADERWEEKPLSYFCDIICGKTPSKKISSYFGGDIPFIKIPDMHNKTYIFETSDSLTEEGKQSQENKTLPPKSICVSCIATVGLVSINTIKSHTNQQINSLVPIEDCFRYFLFLTMKLSYELLNAMASGGTATFNLNTGDFSNIPITYPGKDKLMIFQGQIEPIFDKIFYNQSQIRTLEKLRDTLLPKLMSGEVRVEI
jgi:type I restriction enzyme, S subunit